MARALVFALKLFRDFRKQFVYVFAILLYWTFYHSLIDQLIVDKIGRYCVVERSASKDLVFTIIFFTPYYYYPPNFISRGVK